MAYLRSDPNCIRLDTIPQMQLKIASLGRARLEKDYPSAEKLIERGVPEALAKTLAPFQRGGVDFVLERDGTKRPFFFQPIVWPFNHLTIPCLSFVLL